LRKILSVAKAPFVAVVKVLSVVVEVGVVMVVSDIKVFSATKETAF